jgi:hypothetical protein
MTSSHGGSDVIHHGNFFPVSVGLMTGLGDYPFRENVHIGGINGNPFRGSFTLLAIPCALRIGIGSLANQPM